jgi:hypothetical protein
VSQVNGKKHILNDFFFFFLNVYVSKVTKKKKDLEKILYLHTGRNHHTE